MSGGVDSAVAALLCAGSGEEPLAVTLELWSDPHNDGELRCCSAQAVRGARALAHELGMPHLSIDLRAEFRAGVVDRWLADHAAGLTPNPCVRCNGNVRLDAMLELAERLGASTLATGHYARVVEAQAPRAAAAGRRRPRQGPELRALRARAGLARATALPARRAAQAAGTRARRSRRSRGRAAARLPGSLLPRRHPQRAFLERHGGLGERPGPIVDLEGGVLGEHAGAHLYTVGQRHGLGISAPEPLYVLATDASANTVTVGRARRAARERLEVRAVTLRRRGTLVDGVRVRAHGRTLRLPRPRAPRAGAHERLAIELCEPAERTAPGQIACLYAGDVVVGFGTIAA